MIGEKISRGQGWVGINPESREDFAALTGDQRHFNHIPEMAPPNQDLPSQSLMSSVLGSSKNCVQRTKSGI